MTNEPGDDRFTSRMRKVQDVLVGGEGFVDAVVAYEQISAMVHFRAPGTISIRMRRAEFEAKSDYEVAFFVSNRMRPPVVTTAKHAAKPGAKPR